MAAKKGTARSKQNSIGPAARACRGKKQGAFRACVRREMRSRRR